MVKKSLMILLKILTIFIENKNESQTLQNIFIKDAINSENPKIISAKKE